MTTETEHNQQQEEEQNEDLLLQFFPSREYILEEMGITEDEAHMFEDAILFKQGYLIELDYAMIGEDFVIPKHFENAIILNEDKKYIIVDGRSKRSKKKNPFFLNKDEDIDEWDQDIDENDENDNLVYLMPGVYRFEEDGITITYLKSEDFDDYEDF